MTKVTHTIPFNESSSAIDTIVCKGELVLIPIEFKDWDDKTTIRHIHANKANEYFTPIIISETEEIKFGDDCLMEGRIIKHLHELSVVALKGKRNKILALPENFSPNTLADIISGRLKDGDELFIECERKYIEPEGIHSNRGSDILRIKLNKDNHVKLFPAKKEESWDDIHQELFFLSESHNQEAWNAKVMMYLKKNYNPPTRK